MKSVGVSRRLSYKAGMDVRSRCDLHVHSIHSTDTGNYALRRARLGESYTPPRRVYDVCRRRGMTLVTISDHNTLAGALEIADLPDTFLSVEVTTRFPEDDAPLHVLVWGLTEEDHRDLQPFRPSVYELVDFLAERGLAHALAHPLYRMGPPLTASHVERMMLLFGTWEGRNGARPRSSNLLGERLAAAVTPAYLEKLAERHDLEPRHYGAIALTGGSDDHGGLDIATTWTEAPVSGPDSFLQAIRTGTCEARGAHGSAVKLAHALAALGLNAFRRSGGTLPEPIADQVAALLDEDVDDVLAHHERVSTATGAIARSLGERARTGALAIDALPTFGGRLGSVLLAAGLEAPYLAAFHHRAGTHQDVLEVERAFFGLAGRTSEPRALLFTDTFAEANGVAGTMRRLRDEAAAGELEVTVVTTEPTRRVEPGLLALAPDWSLPLPTYETLVLSFPSLREVLTEVESAAPDVIHVATPGPVGLCGLVAAKLLGIPLVGSYHTELGPYALHLTKDLLVADATDAYVHWFYRQCSLVLAPTQAIANALSGRGFDQSLLVWGRGVDTDLFTPARRDEALRGRLLDGGDTLLLSVGRLSEEKRLEVLLEAFGRLGAERPGARLVVVGDGPARPRLEERAPDGVTFLGELRGAELAAVFASADVFCFPSTTDTFGQVLLEAAASGLPVVAAAAGGAPELVRHGRTGYLVPPDDPAMLAAVIADLVAVPELRRRLGEAAAAAAREERTWGRSLAELRDAYARAAGIGDASVGVAALA
jgi:glycosyltransferase involved in cell wall biosynthesis